MLVPVSLRAPEVCALDKTVGTPVGLGTALRILVLMVAVTLLGTAATLLALRGLLSHISLTRLLMAYCTMDFAEHPYL